MASTDIIKNLFNASLEENAEAKEVFKLFEGEIKEKKAAEGMKSLLTREGKKQGKILLAENNSEKFLNWLKKLGGGDITEFKEIHNHELSYYKKRAESAFKSGMDKKEFRKEYLEEWKGLKEQVQSIDRTLDLGEKVNLKLIKDKLKQIDRFSTDAATAVECLDDAKGLTLEEVKTHLKDYFEASNIKETPKGIELHLADGTANPEKVLIGKINAGKFEAEANGIADAVSAIEARGKDLAGKPIELIEDMEKAIAAGKEQLKEYKTLTDKFGEKLGEKATFVASMTAEATQVAAKAANAPVGAAIREGTALKNASGDFISEQAAKLGVKGGEKASIGERIAANFNTWGKLEKDSSGLIKATESGAAGKAIKGGAAAVGAILMGYGLKDIGQYAGVVGGDVDEEGKEIVADGSKLVKGLAEVGAGGAAVFMTLLGKGKALGMAL